MTVTGAIGFTVPSGPSPAGLGVRAPGTSGFQAALVLLGAVDVAARGDGTANGQTRGPVHLSGAWAESNPVLQEFAGIVPWARTPRAAAAAPQKPAAGRRRRPYGKRGNQKHGACHG